MKEITVVAVTFNHGRKLNVFLDSLLEQHIPERSWNCIILHDGSVSSEDPEARTSAAATRRTMAPYLHEFPLEFQYVESPERENQWGHSLRAQGLDMVHTPYVHITNCDNQYNYGWLERVLPRLKQTRADLLYWPCSHSYKEFDLFDVSLSAGRIDFCNYVLRTDKAQALGFPWRHFEADGAQIEAFVRAYPDAVYHKMTGIFSTHN